LPAAEIDLTHPESIEKRPVLGEEAMTGEAVPSLEEAPPEAVAVAPERRRFSFFPEKKWWPLLLLLLFLVSGYFVYNFSRLAGGGVVSPLGKSSKERGGQAEVPPGEKATIANPLNGVLFAPAQAKVWQARRPLAVLINNHVAARPYHAGLAAADIVYEANAEGGIPRLMPVFLSNAPEKVGSVRSVRVYFVDLAKEVDAWLAHWGGAQVDPNNPAVTDPAADAYARMRAIYVSSLDEMGIGEAAFWREERPGLGREHTGYTSIPKLYAAAYRLYPDQRRELRPTTPWLFKEEAPLPERPESFSASFNFWDFPDYEVRWEYDRTTNTYKRFQGGQPHKDAATNEQLAAKNVILEYLKETSFNDQKHHLYYNTLGSGRAQILRDGQLVEARWRRRFPDERTRYVEEETGEEISFNRGQIWIEIIPEGNEVTTTP
jgi:hypothetical protein